MRYGVRLLLLLFITLVFASVVFACLPPVGEHSVDFSCTNKSALDSNMIAGNKDVIIIENIRHLEFLPDVFDYLIPRCDENVSSVQSNLTQIISDFYSKEYSMYRTEKIQIMPYDENMLYELQPDKKLFSLMDCRYTEANKLGEFLIIHEGVRDYCFKDPCSGDINAVKFLGYLFTHPDIKSLPYLVVIVLGVALLVFCIIYLAKR